MKAVMGRGDSLDTDTAWDLLHSPGFVDAVAIDGETGEPDLDSMNEAIEKLLARYPWLTGADSIPDEEPDGPRAPKVTTGTGKRKPDSSSGVTVRFSNSGSPR
jgi:hypothetical protein